MIELTITQYIVIVICGCVLFVAGKLGRKYDVEMQSYVQTHYPEEYAKLSVEKMGIKAKVIRGSLIAESLSTGYLKTKDDKHLIKLYKLSFWWRNISFCCLLATIIFVVQ